MKKVVSALVALSSFAIAQTNDVTVTAKDVVPQLNNYLGLEIVASNVSTAPKKVRITYELPTVEDGAKYKVDNVLADGIQAATSVNCRVDHSKADNFIFNIRENGVNRYALDAQFTLKAKEDKILCFPISLSNNANFEIANDTKKRLSFKVDQKGSPLDFPVIYNYIPKERYSYVGLNITPNIGAPSGMSIKANVMSKGVNPAPGSTQLMAWDSGNITEVEARTLIDLGIEGYGMYKDSRMLVASVGPLVDYFHWNESTFDGHMFNGVEERTIFMGRCWMIAVFNTYCHFYGNRNTKPDAMTQDEMIYHGKMFSAANDRQIGVFKANDNEGDYLSNSARLINKIMFDANATVYHHSKTPLNGATLFNALARSETPVVFNMGPVINHEDMTAEKDDGPGHVMLIDALAIDSKGDTLVHIINMDNFGNERYAYLNLLKQHVDQYILMKKPTGFMKTDAEYPVDQDYDGDGIVDFDEKYRFLSDPNKADSDGDGISDFDEIYSYISRLEIGSNGFIHAPSGELQISANSFSFPVDYKDSSSFPQWNIDFDGDGIPDGEEDLNKNGIYEPTLGETDPFTANTETAKNDVPENVVFYALEKVEIGKDILCASYRDLGSGSGIPVERISDEDKKNYASPCRISSEAETITDNTISIGSNTSISKVYTKGNVLVQEKGSVFLINFYNKDAWLEDKNTPSKLYTLQHPAQNWPFKVATSLPEYEAGTKSIVIKNGDTLTINDGDKFSRVEVKKGGVLVFGDGEMYIDTLQLDSASIYDIENNRYSTILHLNGPVTWKAFNNKKEEDFIIYKCPEGQKYCPGVQHLLSMASSFKVYQHSNENTVIDTRWVGTIVAPKSDLTLGLTDNANVMAGQFLGKNIKVRSNMDVYYNAYDPVEKPAVTPEEKDTTSTDVKDTVVADTTVKDTTSTDVKDTTSTDVKDSTGKDGDAIREYNFAARGSLNIVGMNRNELMFETSSASRFQVFIARANGTKAAVYSFDKGNIGLNFVSLADAKLTCGKYFVTVKQNGRTSSKMLVIK